MMNILFEYVPAKKNKGLILQVILLLFICSLLCIEISRDFYCLKVTPRLIEGWTVKYITGSGQTAATRDRVHIYETEGKVKPFHRGKDSKTKALSISNDMEVDKSPKMESKKRAISEIDTKTQFIDENETARRTKQALQVKTPSCSWNEVSNLLFLWH